MDAVTPFLNAEGTRKKFSELDFFDIVQIEERNIEEGFQIEYKEKWNEEFKKKHLCKVITSFANSQGGFLFVGIQDKTGKYIGVEKERTDFSVTITQKLATVSPMPKFECKFLENAEDGKGVLVIYVYEGINPPYICDGTVYIRSGSSKMPIKPGRIEIDNLVQKRENYQKEKEKFCVDTFFNTESVVACCTIYLYNAAEKDYSSRKNLRELREELKENNEFQRVCISSESVICYGSKMISANAKTSIVEFFGQGHAKICMPLIAVDERTHAIYSDLFKQMRIGVDVEEVTLINGGLSYNVINQNLNITLKELKAGGFNLDEYEVCVEYKNIKDTMLIFEYLVKTYEELKEKISRDIQDGAYFNVKTMYRSPFVKLEERYRENDEQGLAIQLSMLFFLMFYGVDPDAFVAKLSEVKNLSSGEEISISGYYPKTTK